MKFWLELKDSAIEWCKGKNWLVRLPILLFFFYALVRHLINPFYSSLLGALNLGIHELGHFVFGFMGEAVAVAGGTLLQLAIPIFAVFNFRRQNDFFAMAFSLGWLSTNFFGVATYVADARKLELPLVTPFGGGDGGVYHDWEYMLSNLNLLEYDQVIAGVFRAMAVVSMLACLFAGVWLLWQMIKDSRAIVNHGN